MFLFGIPSSKLVHRRDIRTLAEYLAVSVSQTSSKVLGQSQHSLYATEQVSLNLIVIQPSSVLLYFF